ALGEAPQPTTEHFENLLWEAVRGLDPQRPAWVEDESLMIGHVRIPDTLFAQLRQAPTCFVEIPLEERVERLVQDYGHHPQEALAESLLRIRKRLGPQHCKAALEALEAGDLRTVAAITLRYYDKAYLRGLTERSPDSVTRLTGSAHDLRGLAHRLQHHGAS
ncbi:MAG TPA: hypothetical protein VHL57_07925, partial [Flavobacteriales bacterium]|nr:hypothetical protein [Flavobacteriales bacterium]